MVALESEDVDPSSVEVTTMRVNGRWMVAARDTRDRVELMSDGDSFAQAMMEMMAYADERVKTSDAGRLAAHLRIAEAVRRHQFVIGLDPRD